MTTDPSAAFQADLARDLQDPEFAREYGNLQAILEQDAIDWPEGHPCRDCGRLAIDHPVIPDVRCQGWR